MGVIVDIAHKTADRLLSSSVTVPEHNGVVIAGFVFPA